MTEQGEAQSPAEPKRRRRVSVVGVAGELLITAGVLVFLFLGWQLWLNDIVVGAHQNSAGAALAHNWNRDVPTVTPSSPPSPTASVPPSAPSQPVAQNFGDPIVAKAPKNAVQFAVVYVPRFGADYSRPISEGVGVAEVLNKNGVGHYPGTQMPGQIGNFAVAAHRTTYGAPFHLLATLQVGDKIYVQTQDGYYTYDFRGLEYVRPNGVGVLDPVPEAPGTTPTDRVMTMTSCNPMYSASERIIAYSVLESWQPTSAGAPQAIQGTAAAKG